MFWTVFSQYLGELSMIYIDVVFGPDTFRFRVFLEADGEYVCVWERERESLCVFLPMKVK